MHYGFNRYMVECKLDDIDRKEYNDGVLIDTWWNVNTHKQHKLRAMNVVLIDTWWNVNTSPV